MHIANFHQLRGFYMTTTDDVIIYKSPDGPASLDVRLDHETVWLSQAQLVELFKRDVSVISRHIRNVFVEGELDEASNLQKMQIAGSTKPVVFYRRCTSSTTTRQSGSSPP
jgi:hypothetical protein